MISFESALKILKKYGYNSMTVHPYLYKKNKEIGVNYSYIDNKYGITERVISFHNDIDLDLFLKKYQWFKLNGKKYKVSLKLNNYEISNPEVLYIRNNHVMTDDEMFNIDVYDKNEIKNKKLSKSKRLLLEVENLMNHYYLEKEQKEKYTNNLFNKERELKRYYLDLQNLVDRYNKNNTHPKLDEDKRVFNMSLNLESDINKKIVEFKKKIPSDEELNDLINKAWSLNKDLETNSSYMYALRNNDDIDEEMRIVVTKIDYMKELLDKRKYKLVNLKKKFDSIDSQSTYESIYDDNFETKYKDFIDKKYNVKNQINEFRLSEYLNNFKTNKEYDIARNVSRCKNEIDKSKKDDDVSFDKIKDDLKKQFNSLSDKEQASLILYNSIYRELFDMIESIDNYEKISTNELMNLLNITPSFFSIFDECYTKVKDLLKYDVNKEINNTIFKNVNFENKKLFLESIKALIKTLSNINDKMVLKYNYKLYFSTNDFDNLEKDRLLYTSSIISPFMVNKGNNYRVITANVNKGVNVLFSPKIISLPLANAFNKQIEVYENENSEIIIDTRDVNINKDQNTIVYSRFNAHSVNTKNYTYIDKFDLNYKININKVIIEKRK